MLELVILSVGVVVCMGVILGLGIGFTAKIFTIQQDHRIEVVTDALPGANCGGCGYAGCADFAKALVAGKEEVSSCPVCSADDCFAVADILGLKVDENAIKNIAVVLCGGDRANAKQDVEYNGVNDCKSAVLVAGGAKGCKFGCLGLGSCAAACPFNAIEITSEGLAVIHADLCVGCAKCITTCPKKIIKMVPENVKLHVFCSSKDKGIDKKKVCSVSCIGCRKCVKKAEPNQMLINGFLVQVNYDLPPSQNLIEIAECPTGCLRLSD